MVTQMGMSDKLGNVDLDSNYDRLSSETKQHIEKEVRRLVEEGRERATKLLNSKRKELDLLAEALVEYESLNKDEMEKVVKGEKLPDRPSSIPTMPLKLPDALLPPGVGGEGVAGAKPGSTAAKSDATTPPRPGKGGAKL
jgi:ATP-dependent metalloprotease